MCILCAIGQEIEHHEEKNQLQVGVVSEQLRQEFHAYKKAEALADIEVDQLVLNFRRAWITGEIGDAEVERCQADVDKQRESHAEKLEAAHTALWNRIYEELGITNHNRNYTINTETGEITTKRRRGDKGAGANVH
jgi:hypothetical protein